jgi:hypothetical protein
MMDSGSDELDRTPVNGKRKIEHLSKDAKSVWGKARDIYICRIQSEVPYPSPSRTEELALEVYQIAAKISDKYPRPQDIIFTETDIKKVRPLTLTRTRTRTRSVISKYLLCLCETRIARGEGDKR